KNLLVTAYANLGVAESLKYLESKSPKDLEILIATSKKAVEISQKYPNQVSKYNYAIALLNLTDYQANFSVQSSQIKEEMKQNCFKIIELSKNIPNAQNVSSGALGILSKLAIEENNLDVAEKYLLDANDILLTQNKKDYYALISIATELANLYDRKQNFQQAFEFQKKVTEYSNLLYDQGQAETSKKLEAQFQGKEKDLELKSLTEKAENIKKERILYIFLGIIGFVGTFFMFRSYHFKLRYSVGREKQLNAEKKETAIELKFKEEEQARLQAEQELMTLHKQILKEESLMDNNFEKTQFIIQETHPNFFKNLSEHSKQKLTPLDLKYCSYIYLGMDTKQIATILNVEPKSVRMTKYRLKQKFDLKKEDELYTFFHQIIA
ncbi:MAG: LuxR C-terminal-related transcriptional regulator, partial [Algoriella sp.]